MKRVVIALAVVAAIAASAAGAAGSGGGDDPYELARTWSTPLGEVYGPAHAGAESSASYGFVGK
jgi:hypothetical protein